jgi:hypothetical protein
MTSTQETAPTIQQYASFPFDTDVDYQQGLESILAGGVLNSSTDEQAREEMLLKTRVFYFNRYVSKKIVNHWRPRTAFRITGNSLTIEEARQAESGNLDRALYSRSPDAQGHTEEAPVLSFAQLKELIESEKIDQIPNNKLIPTGLNHAPASTSSAAPRKKPWETETGEAA